MKATLFALFVGLLLVGCGEDIVDGLKLQDRNGVTYLQNEETPFTGRARIFNENGQKQVEGSFKDGKQDGLWIKYNENGQKKREANYKDGKLDGLFVEWHENGQKLFEVNFKDGEEVEGSEKFWNSKGEPVDSLEEAEAE